ncbi:MAG: DUF4097 family beta strand repeat-containing protein [Thermomonas haemolytica]
MRLFAPLLSLALLATSLPALAGTPIDQTRPLDPRGRVEVENARGRVEVVAWDRPEVKLSGTLGTGVDRLSVEGDARVLRIKVQYPPRSKNPEPTQLVLQVPRLADLEVNTVSADIRVSGVAPRELSLQAVSGDIRANGAPQRARISAVSGDVQLAMNTPQLKVETVSGDLVLQGRLNGEISLESVSGDIRLDTLGERLRRLSASSVSGDMQLKAALGEDGEIRLESVSGELRLQLPATLSANLSAETFSGKLSAPGAVPKKEGFGPGSSLRARYGAGKGEVRMQTFSGDASLAFLP